MAEVRALPRTTLHLRRRVITATADNTALSCAAGVARISRLNRSMDVL
jgi:hypothetical protein